MALHSTLPRMLIGDVYPGVIREQLAAAQSLGGTAEIAHPAGVHLPCGCRLLLARKALSVSLPAARPDRSAGGQ